MVAAFERRRDLIVELLNGIDGVRFPVPDGAFYIFMNVGEYYRGGITCSAELASYLLQEHHVATVPGSAFGDDESIRLSYACSEEDIREGVARIGKGLELLRG